MSQAEGIIKCRVSSQIPKMRMLSMQKSFSHSEDDHNFLTKDYFNTVKNFHKKLDQSNKDSRCDRFGNIIIQGAFYF